MFYFNLFQDFTDKVYVVSLDAEFESAVLGCTIEDQKRVKKRLHGLYSYFATYTVSSDREAT